MVLAELIVRGPQIFIGENLVCFTYVLELLVGSRVIGVLVWDMESVRIFCSASRCVAPVAYLGGE